MTHAAGARQPCAVFPFTGFAPRRAGLRQRPQFKRGWRTAPASAKPQPWEEPPIFTTAPLRDRVRIVAEQRPTAPTVVHAAGISDCGQQRTANQDRWAADAVLGLYLVADGMGGTAHGELAAQMIVDLLPLILRKELRGIRDLGDPR